MFYEDDLGNKTRDIVKMHLNGEKKKKTFSKRNSYSKKLNIPGSIKPI